MKEPDIHTLRQLGRSELEEKAQEYKHELFQSRFALKAGQLSDASKVRKARRRFAQVQTLISERRQSATVGGAT